MIRIRPLAGAVLMTLLLTPVAFADRVDVITPGGHAGLNPPITGTEPIDTKPVDPVVDEPPRTASSDSSSSGGDPSVDFDVQPGLQTRHFGGATLACKVASTSKDLVVINQSLDPLPPGTRIKWQLKNEGKRGYFAIIGELGGGESLVADNVLDGQAGTDDVCIARVI